MAKSLKKQNRICVFYPCTQKELKSGDLYKSISRIISKKPSEKYSFDLFLILDNLPESDFNLNKILDLENTVYLNKIYTHSLNLSESENLYIKHWDSRSSLPEIIPPHGISSGPNNSFYQSLYYLLAHPNRYQYSLLLETDIQILKTKWLDHILNFCQSNEFSIAGSKYKGIQKWHRVLDYKDHLNGIAIYNLNKDLYKILKSSEDHLIKSVKSGVPFINFDIAIDEWRRSEEGSRFFNNSNKLIDTKFITNASDPEDSNLSKFKILKHYPDTIILHHKTNSSNFSFTSQAVLHNIDYLDPKIELIKKLSKPSLNKINIPIFFHIPKNAGTFIESLIANLLRRYNRLHFHSEYPRELRITIKGLECFNIFFIDSKNILGLDKSIDHIDSITYRCEISDVPIGFFDSISPFSITVNSNGFRHFNTLFNFFDSKFYSLRPFLALRDPLDRALSLYEYNNSFASSHDEKHGSISYNTFIEYTSSMQFEDAWIIRNLLDVKDEHEISEAIYEKFLKFISYFNIVFTEDSDFPSKIGSLYENIYDGLSPHLIPNSWLKDTPLNKNENKNKKFSRESLSEDHLQVFNEKSKFDYKLYNSLKSKFLD